MIRLAVVTVLTLTMLARAQDGPGAVFAEAQATFSRALELARTDAGGARDVFAQAAAGFEHVSRLVAHRSPRVLVNAGNAHVFAGDLGSGVIAYRRALALDPADARAREGLRSVRARLWGDPPARAGWLSGLVDRAGRIPRGWALALGVILWWLGWASLAIPRLIRARSGAVALALLGGVIVGGVLAERALSTPAAARVLVVDSPPALKGPGEGLYQPSFTSPLKAGTEARAREVREGWVRIALPDGRETWVPESAARPIWE